MSPVAHFGKLTWLMSHLINLMPTKLTGSVSCMCSQHQSTGLTSNTGSTYPCKHSLKATPCQCQSLPAAHPLSKHRHKHSVANLQCLCIACVSHRIRGKLKVHKIHKAHKVHARQILGRATLLDQHTHLAPVLHTVSLHPEHILQHAVGSHHDPQTDKQTTLHHNSTLPTTAPKQQV